MLSKKLFGVFAVLSLAAGTAAQAGEERPSMPSGERPGFIHKHLPHHSSFWFFGHDRKDPKHPVAAPEIDPASALASLTMLAGGLAVIRGRRVKK